MTHDENNLTTTARVYASTIWQDKNLFGINEETGHGNGCLPCSISVTSSRIDTIKLLIDCHANQRVDARLLEGSAQNPHIRILFGDR